MVGVTRENKIKIYKGQYRSSPNNRYNKREQIEMRTCFKKGRDRSNKTVKEIYVEESKRRERPKKKWGMQ